MKNAILSIVVVSLSILMGACENKSEIAPSGLKLKIGVITPLTGSDKANGQSVLDGIKTAKQLHPMLDNGDQLELVIEDDQSNPNLALEALKKLATIDKVSAVLIGSRSNTLLSIVKMADKYQTPILATIASSPEITQHSKWISQLSFDDTVQATVTALYVRDELLVDKVAVFSYPQDPHYHYLGTEFISKFESVDGTITDHIQLDETADNLVEILENVRKNNPTLLYVPVKSKHVLSIAKHVGELDWNPIIMGSDGLLAKVLAEHKKELQLVDGMLAADLYYHDMTLTSYGKQLKKIVKALDINANSQTIISMEGYGLLVDAMNRCNPPVTRKCINKYLRSTENFQGVLGYISIDSKGKAQRPLLINSIENGKMRFIVKVY